MGILAKMKVVLLLSVLLGLALCLHASELEAQKDVEEATDIKGPEEAEDFDENDLEEPNDEEQDALSEDENSLDVKADPAPWGSRNRRRSYGSRRNYYRRRGSYRRRRSYEKT